MKRAVWLSVVLALTISAAGAEPFGAPFPVTNTRYRTALGAPRLVTNDRDFFLFWRAEKKIRAARVDDGEARVSHVVLDNEEAFDVAWTGDHHLIVSTRTPPNMWNAAAVFGRLLDAEARPIGAEFAMGIANGQQPRVAAGPDSIALVYGSGRETRLTLLSKNGRVVSESRVIAPRGGTHAVTRHGDGFLAIVTTPGSIRAIALDQHGQTVAERSYPGDLGYEVAVASNGKTALVVWFRYPDLVAIPIGENATFGTPFVFAKSVSSVNPTVVWNGGGWTVSYVYRKDWQTTQAVIAQLHWRGQMILSQEELAVHTGNPTVAVLDGRMLAAWREPDQETMSVQRLPLADHQPRQAPYTPSPQTLLASASSSDATLTVWSEKTGGAFSIHAGLRNLQGQWSERQVATLPSAVQRAVAASDGDGFAIVLSQEWSSSSLILLDATGRLVGSPVLLPIHPALAMAWNGTNYGLIDDTRHGVVVTRSGAVSNRFFIDVSFNPVALASDGNGFFLAGHRIGCANYCYPVEIRGVRLGPDLTPLDQHEYAVPGSEARTNVVGAAWDGSKYFVVGYDDIRGNFIADIPPSPRSAIETRAIPGVENPQTMALLRDGTIALADQSRASLVSRDGALLHISEIEGSLTTAPRLEPLPDGGVAFLVSSVQNAAPHDGTSRVVAAIARSSSVTPPGAPHAGVRVQNGNILVDWSAPSGTVNGYRLEYRIDDDEWVELEQWFGPGAQSKSIRQPSFGTQFAFRVRAFNDGGAGEYSRTAVTKPSRRRAVR
jgi:hypothetical protein